jgi:hypothetical protein
MRRETGLFTSIIYKEEYCHEKYQIHDDKAGSCSRRNDLLALCTADPDGPEG